MRRPKKLISYMLILLAIIVGVMIVVTCDWKNEFLFGFASYMILAILPFSLGYFWINKKSFKKEYWFRFRVFTGITIVIPVGFKLYPYFLDEKQQELFNTANIYIDAIALPAFFTAGVVVALIVGVIALLSIYINWFKLSKKMYFLFSISVVSLVVMYFMTEKDYKAINEDGIIVSLEESHEEIAWTDVESVYLSSYVSSDRSRKYVWEFIFYLKDGEEITIGPFRYEQDTITTSLTIKEKIMQQKIAMYLDGLTDEDWQYVQSDMEGQTDVNPQDFYTLIQYNPETKEYYDMPYKEN
ncbi:MAG: hypothetical protein ACI33M_05440 [Lysinibacillus sp.]